jgi:hypothetical protein
LVFLWTEREGPQIDHLSFYIFAVGPKNTKCPRMGLIIGLRGRFAVKPALFLEPEPVPGAPGARRGPQGAENRSKNRGRIYHFLLPKVCPVLRPPGFSRSSPRAPRGPIRSADTYLAPLADQPRCPSKTYQGALPRIGQEINKKINHIKIVRKWCPEGL